MMMVKAEIWENLAGLWQGRVIDPVTGRPDWFVWSAKSRGSLIANMQLGVPVTHLEFVDTICPPDP